MGFTGAWIASRGRLGWEFADADGTDVESEVRKLSKQHGAAVGASVFDSDFAVIVAGKDGSVAARLVVNPETADEYGIAVRTSTDAFAEWTEETPRQLTPENVQEVLGRRWVLAEEGAEELLERAGLARALEARAASRPASVAAEELVGYRAPLGWMSDVFVLGDQEVAWRDARFVPGLGDDFLGIWDRTRPHEPVARFAPTAGGERKLLDRLVRLQEPLVRRIFGAEDLSGFRQPLRADSTAEVAQRHLPIREARYVAGRGEGFVGVWDRGSGAEPIGRFPETDEGEAEAFMLAYRLLFEHEATRTELPGGRLYLPARGPWEGPWLLTEEIGGDAWPTEQDEESGPWFLYRFLDEPPTELGLICQGSFPSAPEAQAQARRFGATGDWRELPDEVPRNLLEAARWLAASVEPGN